MNIPSPFVFADTQVKFKFSPAKKDTQHLIIVFTAIRTKMEILDFDHDGPLLQFNRSNILWIYDDFGPEYSYYLCQDRSFHIESAVLALIDAVVIDLGLSKDQCTAVGMSKGGSAALRLGIKAGLKNIVALVPQIGIGSYLKNRKRFPIMEHMSGGSKAPDILWLDNLIPEVILSEAQFSRNVYVITSPYDPHCVDFLGGVLPGLRKYENFNLISTASDLCRSHLQTLRYNVPFIVSLLGVLSEGIAPAFGETSNGPGFSGAGHRDGHPMLSSKFGGLLSGASDAPAAQQPVLDQKEKEIQALLASRLSDLAKTRSLQAQLQEATAELASIRGTSSELSRRLSSLSRSKLGSLQLRLWRSRSRARARRAR